MALATIEKLLMIQQQAKTDENSLEVPVQDFYKTAVEKLEAFDARCWNKGDGYNTGKYPIFDGYMEGLETGLFLFAALSNSGKSAIMLDLLWSYAMNENNHLSCLYFSLDDTASKIIPRVIAKEQGIPISVVSKPKRYQNMIETDGITEDDYTKYSMWLERRNTGLQQLKNSIRKFSIIDGTELTCGEQILDYCIKYQEYVKADDPEANIIIGIDSVADVTFAGKKFNTENEYNNYAARELKRWAAEVLKVPVFGTMHLRKIDVRKRPTISDVKESGRWVYEADMVFLLHNDMSINKENAFICLNDENGKKIPVIEMDWAKNKQSAYKGRTFVEFRPDYSYCQELTEEAQRDMLYRINSSI